MARRSAAKVTLRGDHMYGISGPPGQYRDSAHPGFSRHQHALVRRPRHITGLGVKEQIIFPEIQYDQIEVKIRGMDITISTSARDDKHGRALLEAFNFPFCK